MCREVRKLIKSRGDGAGGGSWKMAESGVAEVCPLARLIVSLKDEKPRDVDEDIEPWLWVGERGRLGVAEDPDVAVGFLGDGGPAFFLLAKLRRNDHSDSN